MEERVHQEILDSVKEHLQHRQECTQSQEKLRQIPAGTTRPEQWAEFHDRVCTTYDHFKDLKEGSCEEALSIV